MTLHHTLMAKLASALLALSLVDSSIAFRPQLSCLASGSSSSRQSRGFALRERPSDFFKVVPAATSSTASDWIKDEFEHVQLPPQKDDVKSAGSFSSSVGLLNQGRIVGPGRVLVYDTTLRGELEMMYKYLI